MDFSVIASALAVVVETAPAAAALSGDVDHGLATMGKGLAFGLAALGGAIGIGLVFMAAITGIARQPEQAGQLRTMAFLGFAFIEALVLIGFVLTFIMK